MRCSILIFIECPLFGLQSKKMLTHLLHIKDSKLFKQEYVASLVSPYIDQSGKKRLIEPPQEELKDIQKRLKVMLGKIIVPNNIFSGIKGRSYADNAILHTGENRRMLFKIDLTAFFPTITRETVYKFFKEDLCCSPDIAEILTIGLEKSNATNFDAVYSFLDEKGVACKNHLISGAPTSQIMSYLVNYRMFDEMQIIADENNATMTVYVDDVTFSSECRISQQFTSRIVNVVKKYGYKISKTKVKKYTKLYPKLVTGVIIDSNGQAIVKNSIKLKIINEYKNLLNNPEDIKSRQRLRGLLTAARQVNPNIFPTIYNYAFEKSL